MADSVASRRLAVMMADVVGSTALYEVIGDRAARRLVGACLQRLEGVVQRHAGRIVKTLGDGLLCVFADAAAALAAAREMIDDSATDALMIRIAAHVGNVIEERDDVFGDTVNTVARIAGLAADGEVLVSRTLFDELPEPRPLSARPLPPVAVKGKREPLEMVSIAGLGRETVQRSTAAVDLLPPATALHLRLAYAGTELVVTADQPIAIGRDPSNTLAIDHPSASRFHARIYLQGGGFVLADQSSNGTWIVPDGHPAVRIHRRETTILGSGRIHVGADPDATPTPPITYRLA